MVAYKFYLRDAVRNCFDHFGVLPERRMDPERITDESVVKCGRKYFGTNAKDQDIFFFESVSEDSEKGFLLPLCN